MSAGSAGDNAAGAGVYMLVPSLVDARGMAEMAPWLCRERGERE